MENVSFENGRKEKLSGILAKPGKDRSPCVIICHGLGSSKDNKAPIMEALAGAGIASLAFDFHGHGDSEGSFEELTVTKAVEDAKAAADFVSALDFVDPKRIGMMGHSLGGTVTLIAAGSDRRIRALEASAPLTDFPEAFRMLSDFDIIFGNLNVWKEKGYTHYYNHAEKKHMKLKYSFFEDAVRYDQKGIAKKIKCPVLLMHGSKDRAVPLAQSERFLSMLSCEKELRVLDCGHDFQEKDLKALIEVSSDWFSRQL